MPISNGKYINPGWNNGAPPAIDAAELNAISTILENLDANGGGSGKRYASVVVGTTTGGWTQADCDYLCDGTADQVQINAAIASLNGGNGEVKFLSGTYILNSSIDLSSSSNIKFTGSGESTIIVTQTLGNTTIETSGTLSFTASGIYLKNIAIFGTVGNAFFYDCILENLIFPASTYSIRMSNNKIIYPSGVSVTSQFGIRPILYESGKSYVDSNVFVVENTSSSMPALVNAFSPGFSVTSNVFFCQNNKAISTNEKSNVSGNTVINGNIYAVDCSVQGNYIYNGVVSVRAGNATGNTVYNGNIVGVDDCDISGNYVNQESNVGSGCIVLLKGANNSDPSLMKSVTGNTCIGGESGIYLSESSFPSQSMQNANISGNSCSSSVPLKINSNWSNCLITGNMFPNGTIVDNGSSNTKANNITG